MRNYEPTNNYAEIRSRIALRVLNHPLARYIGYHGSPSRYEYLEKIAAKEGDKSMTFLRVEFRRASTSCDLYIEQEVQYGHRDDGYRRDKEGNDQVLFTFRAEVNHPCHGSADPATLLARIELYREVALFAAELIAELKEEIVWRLERTVAQREEQEAKEKAEKVQRTVTAAINAVRTNMRVNAVRSANLTDALEIPDGEYEHQFSDGKKYTLVVKTEGEVRVVLVGRIS